MWIVALSPVLATILAVIVNYLTSAWSWWLFAALVAGVVLVSVTAVILETRTQHARPPASLWFEVPPRSGHFTGRSDLLRQIGRGLRDRTGPAAVVASALHGAGGVGKTHLAIEYAARHSADYDLVAWISAERTELVRAGLLRLADRIGVPRADDADRTIDALRDALRRGDPYLRWLLIFDNAEAPTSLREYLPPAVVAPVRGHVLITSRDRSWAQFATPIEVDVLDRTESVALVRRRLPAVSAAQADELADRLGDLPLAIEQATGWINGGSGDVGQYLGLLDRRIQDLLDANHPADYQLSVAAAWSLAIDTLQKTDPDAVVLLALCAQFGPEPIALGLLAPDAAPALTPELVRLLGDPLRLRSAIIAIGRLSLARVDNERMTIQLHRLIRAFLRARTAEGGGEELRDAVHALLAAATPDAESLDDPEVRPSLDNVAPHFVAAGCLLATTPVARRVVLHQARYRFQRGDFGSCAKLCEEVLPGWARTFPAGDDQLLQLRHILGDAWHWSGQTSRAYELDAQTMRAARHHLGDTHPTTLRTALTFARDLRFMGRYQDALDLDRTGLTVSRAVFGHDHARTMLVQNNLAVDLRFLGRFDEALTTDTETLELRSRTLGPDHWHTAFSRAAVACDHLYLGDFPAAFRLSTAALHGMRTAVGDHHMYIAVWMRVRAIAAYQAGHRSDAIRWAREAVAVFTDSIGPDAPETVKARMSLATIVRTRRAAEALALADSAYRRCSEVFDEGHPMIGVSLSTLGLALRAAGQDAAADRHAAAYSTLRDNLGEHHWATLGALANVAAERLRAGDHERAVTEGRTAYEDLAATLGPDHPYALIAGHNLARSLIATARPGGQELRGAVSAGLRSRLGPRHEMVARARGGRALDVEIHFPAV